MSNECISTQKSCFISCKATIGSLTQTLQSSSWTGFVSVPSCWMMLLRNKTPKHVSPALNPKRCHRFPIYPFFRASFFSWRSGRLRNPTQAIGVSFFFVSFNLVNGSLVATADTRLFDWRMGVYLVKGEDLSQFAILFFPSIQSQILFVG